VTLPDQAVSAQPASKQGTSTSQASGSEGRPGVFLMINSFETGGSERQFAALAGSLDPESFRLNLGCVMQKGSFLEGFGDVPTFGLGGSLYRWQSIKARLRLARHLRDRDVQIAHSFDFYTNLTLIPAARLAGVPVVIGSQRQLGDLLTRAQTRVQTEMFRWCDAVVCNSRAAADLLVAGGLPATKTFVIGNGLPPLAFAQAEPALPRISGRVRIGMVARMNTSSKNHKIFIQTASSLCSQYPELDFVLVGDGPLRGELEREADSLGCKNRVSFLGDRRDIPAVLASLDVSVLPSASESLSNVILESMAAGVPVIANRVGGNIELLGDDRGVLIQPNDKDALAQAVGSLVREPGRRLEIGRRAREFARANFSLENMRIRHEQLYLDLLRRKKWHSKPTVTESSQHAGRVS
jgi:glycosyltransferase involved in cell wall biosynthesis